MLLLVIGVSVLVLLVAARARSRSLPATDEDRSSATPTAANGRLALPALLEAPPERRDDGWADQLRRLLPTGSFLIAGSCEAAGTVGARCVVSRVTESCQGSITFRELLESATEQGSGLLLSATTDGPTTEVRFGALATMRMFNNWRAPGLWSGSPAPEGESRLSEATEVMFGAPNYEYLPEFVRSAIRKHLVAVGVRDPRVMLVYWPSQQRRELIFSVYPALFGSRLEYEAQMRAILWYLPDGYQILTAESMAEHMSAAVPL